MSALPRSVVPVLVLSALAVLIAGCEALGDRRFVVVDETSTVWRPDIVPLPARPNREAAFVPDLDPSALLGLMRADVAALLGPPRLLRRDPPAEMWQYRTEECVLHVFLYAAPADTGYRVRHVELRGHDRAPVPAKCYTELIRAPGETRSAG